MKNIRILLITRDISARQDLVHHLQAEAEFEVIEFGSSREALEHLGKVTEDYYTVVLLDLGLDAEMSVDSLLDTIREEHPRLPVIVITQRETAKDIRNPQNSAYRYLSPLINPIEIANIIQDLTDPGKVREELLKTLDGRQQARQEVEALRKISTTISSEIELEEVATTILDELRRIIEYRTASIQLIQDDNRFLIAGCGFEGPTVDEWLVRPISQDPLIKHIIDTQEIFIIPSVSAEPRWETSHAKEVKAWVGAPLNFKGETIGLLTLDHDQKGYYTESLRETLGPFCSQAAIALQNARRVQDLEIVTKIADVIGDKFNSEDLLDTLADQIANQLDCTHCSIFLARKESNETWLVLATAHGPFKEEVKNRRFTPDFGVAGWVYRNGKSAVIPDARYDERFEVGTVKPKGPRSMLVAPIKVGNRTIGIISADQDKLGWFSENDRRLVDAMAQQVGIAIQRVTGLGIFEEIAGLTTSQQDVQSVLAQIVKRAVELFNVNSGVIHLIHEDGQHLEESVPYPENFPHPKSRFEKQKGLTYRIFQNSETVIVDEAHKASYVNRAKGIVIQSIIGVPLQYEGKVIGVLFLNDNDPHQYSEAELSLLSTLADQAAIAIENNRLFERWRNERKERIETIREIGLEITTGTDLGTIYETLLKKTLKLMKNATTGEIWLMDKQIGKIKIRADESGAKKPKIRELELGKGIVGYVAKSKRPYLMVDAKKDKHYLSEFAATQSELAAPLLKGKQLLGVLNVEHTKPNAFTEEDKPLLEAIAGQIVIAIENNRLFRELQLRTERLQRLQEVTKTIMAAPSDLQKNLESVENDLQEIFESKLCIIRLYDANRNEFGVRIATGKRQQEYKREPRPDGTSYYVINKKKALYIENVDKPPRGRPSIRQTILKKGIKAAAELPLLGQKNAVVGILYLFWDAPHSFSKDETQILELFASLAAIAIENGRTFADLQQRTGRLQRLQNVAKTITAERSERDILDLIINNLTTIFEDPYCGIRLYDSVTNKFKPRISSVISDELLANLERPPRVDGSSYQAIQSKKPVYLDDPSLKLQNRQQGIRQELLAIGIQATAVLPLLIRNEVIGILYLNLYTPHHFSQNDKHILELFADQAAIAIENARLFEQRTKDIEALQIINQAVIEKDRGEILQLIVDKAVEVMPGEYSELWLREAETGNLICEATSRTKGVKLIQQIEHIKAGASSINMQVLETGKPYISPDVTKEKNFIRMYKDVQSSVTVPLKYRGDVTGTLNVESSRLNAFTIEHGKLLDSFSDQAAVAIQNALLLAQIQKQYDQLLAMHGVGKEIVASLDWEATSQSIVGKVCELTNADRSLLLVIDEDTEKVTAKGVGYPAEHLEKFTMEELHDGLSGWVLKHKEAVLIPDVQQDPRSKGLAESKAKLFRSKSICIAPLISRGGVEIGTLTVVNKTDKPAFPKETKDTLEAFADLAVIAIENAQTNEKLDQQLARTIALSKLGEYLSTIELED